jgi:hypothetical protein
MNVGETLSCLGDEPVGDDDPCAQPHPGIGGARGDCEASGPGREARRAELGRQDLAADARPDQTGAHGVVAVRGNETSKEC